MRLTSVLAFCATVYGLAISNVLNGTDISVPQDDSTAATHEDHFSANQRITYKGQKASVNIKDLWNYGKEWVAAAGKKIDANHNCLRYFDFLVSKI
ncbi:hypothetical protein CGMCC3_g17973 [Colletotrichum fructicola]|nr:uncharacterized protein CGMCC3_g17973 [Colletotrichum fructicola]KAE9565846.1 hypothetical protein CGMCC3_g17973 [Colletotrichum fructicola]